MVCSFAFTPLQELMSRMTSIDVVFCHNNYADSARVGCVCLPDTPAKLLQATTVLICGLAHCCGGFSELKCADANEGKGPNPLLSCSGAASHILTVCCFVSACTARCLPPALFVALTGIYKSATVDVAQLCCSPAQIDRERQQPIGCNASGKYL